jgi:hypothetical protein
MSRPRPNYQHLSGTDVPAALILERKASQNKRNVLKFRRANTDLRALYPEDYEVFYAERAKELEAEPIVGDPCQYGNCPGIEGLKGQHKQYCPGEKAAKYKRD